MGEVGVDDYCGVLVGNVSGYFFGLQGDLKGNVFGSIQFGFNGSSFYYVVRIQFFVGI